MIAAFLRWRRRRQIASRIGYLIRHQRAVMRTRRRLEQEVRIQEMSRRRVERGWK